MTGVDDVLKLEAVYFSAPIPHNLAVLTILGAVFDKVYFPGVWMPKAGYDLIEVQKEIERLEALPQRPSAVDRGLLIGAMKFLKYRETLEGFCEFTGTDDDPFGDKKPIPTAMVNGIYEAIHGPPRPGFTPMFETGHAKGLPGGEESIIYPGTYHYLAGAIIHSAKTGIPLLNDIPELSIPGIPDLAPADDAKLLAAIIAVRMYPHRASPHAAPPARGPDGVPGGE